MKNVLRILLIMGISNSLFAQDIINTCISDGIEIVSQEQIDSFSTAYPGCNTILGNVKISGNDIQSLQGLNQIKTIRGNLEISDNAQLQRLAGIERLDSVYGNFSLVSNPALQLVSDLDSLKFVGGGFLVNGNASLTSIEGLDSLHFIGISLRIIFNPLLTNISGFSQLHRVPGNFSIGGSPALEIIQPLNIRTIEGNVAIVETHIKDLLWLDALKAINGYMNITGNSGLKDLTGLDSLENIRSGAIISGNSGLLSLNGLDLDSIAGSFALTNNSAIINLAGLDSLRTINGDLVIEANASLQNLLGLDSLTHIRGNIVLSGNPKLEDIRSLSQVLPLEVNDITIEDSPELSDCAIESICGYLADGSQGLFINNGEGCSSVQEISSACLVGVTNTSKPERISVYPNPAADYLFFKLDGMDDGLIRIFNVLGDEVLRRSGLTNALDVSHLATGMYTLQFSRAEEVLISSFFKM